MNFTFYLFTVFWNVYSIILVRFVGLFHIVQQGIIHVVLIEQWIFVVFLQFTTTRKISRVVVSSCDFKLSNHTLTTFNKIKSLGQSSFMLDIISISETNFLHIDSYREQRLVSNFLLELKFISTYLKEVEAHQKLNFVCNFIVYLGSQLCLGS